jgi:hypothetical protein
MARPRPVRYRCDLKARIELDTSGALCSARLVELSETGGFVEEVPALADVQPGEGATVALPLPGGAPLTARVTFLRAALGRVEIRTPLAEHLTVQVRGFALSFERMGAEDAARLRDFLDLLDTR